MFRAPFVARFREGMPCFPFKVYSDLPKRCFGKKQDNKLLINWPTGDVNVMMFDVQLLKKKENNVHL